jgi:hypothetical protein
MSNHRRCLATVFATAGAAGAIMLAPVAAAIPECAQTGPTTTLCSTNGSAQLVTSPPIQNGPYWGWPYGGGFGISIGGWGFGW